MKRFVCVVLSVGMVLCFTQLIFAADRDAIKKNVDDIVSGVNNEILPTDYKAEAYTPYIFILEENGKMLVHPSLTGQNIKDVAGPVYQALVKATTDGVWVDYEWKGSLKHSYVKKTSSGLIVGSGYSD